MRETEKRHPRHANRKRSRRIAGPARRGRPRSRRARVFWRRRALGVAAIAGGLLVMVVAVGYLGTGGSEIRRGVEAGGVELGGMTRDEAREAIVRRASTALGEIKLVNGEEEIPLRAEDLGVKIDAAATAEEAYAVGRRGGAFQRLSDALGSYLGGAVRVPADVRFDEGAARDTLADVARRFDREPEDATPTVGESGKVEVQGGVEGRIMDQEATLARLDRALDALRTGEVPLAARTKEPEISPEEARALAPTQLVGEYKTDFAWDPDPARQSNLRTASGAIDNTLLAPGETFSAIEVLEPLDYEEAKVFADGGVSSGVGGGLCQVTSTLYMAASYAGLEIVERNPHYALLPYISPGFDATVWFGGSGIEPLDMKFKNSTGGYIMIREYVDEDGFLTAQVYAQKPTGVNVEMNSEKTEEDLQKGITWVTSKKVTARSGEVVSDEVLYEDTYSYNPPVPEEMRHETNEPRTSGWADPTNTTGWADVD